MKQILDDLFFIGLAGLIVFFGAISPLVLAFLLAAFVFYLHISEK